jgi:hypothetical protein
MNIYKYIINNKKYIDWKLNEKEQIYFELDDYIVYLSNENWTITIELKYKDIFLSCDKYSSDKEYKVIADVFFYNLNRLKNNLKVSFYSKLKKIELTNKRKFKLNSLDNI